MHLVIYLITLVISIIVLFALNYNENDVLPCDYLDSINITGGMLQADESILFNGQTFSKDQYARVDFILKNGMTHEIVTPYYRGCICNRKSCVRLCCPLGSFHENGSCQSHHQVRHLKTEVLDENMQTKSMILDNHFAYVNDRPCNKRYLADSTFQITYTGSILFEGKHFNHRRYCLNPKPDNDHNNELVIDAQVCQLQEEQPEEPLAEGMMLSVPFIMVTILVYLILPELHSFYGKCLIYHLMSLAMGYIILGVTHLNNKSIIVSESLGYAAYFSFISSFFWISIISFELYSNFRSPDRVGTSSEAKQSFSYILCVWGFSLVLTVGISLIDLQLKYTDLDGGLKTCFLDFKNNAQCSYYYIPIWVLFAINQIFFTIIAFKINRSRHLNRENARQAAILLMASRELPPNETPNEESFALYFRLHLVICLTWIFKGLALLEANKLVIYSHVSYAVQGLVIFVLFVLNRPTLQIIGQRWQKFTSNMNKMVKKKKKSVAPIETVVDV